MVQYPNPVVQQMVLTYDTGTTSIQIGPGPSILFFNASGTQVASFTGTVASWGTPTNPGIVIDASNAFTSVLAFPTRNAGEVFPAKFQSDVMGLGPTDPGRQYRTIYSTARIANGGPTDTFISIWYISQSVDNTITPYIDFSYTGPTSQARLISIQPGRNGTPVLIGNNQVWRQLTLLNGYTPDSFAGLRNGLWILYTPDGMARLEGRIFAPAVPGSATVIAQLPTNLGFPTVPGASVEISCFCNNAQGACTVMIRKNGPGNSSCVEQQGFPNLPNANGFMAIGHTFYVGDGTLS